MRDDINAWLAWLDDWLSAPSGLMMALAMKESGYNPDTGVFDNTCHYGDNCGLMQLRPGALSDIRRMYGYAVNPLDPFDAMIGAALLMLVNDYYIRYYTKRSPDWPTLIVAYNGGWQAGRYYMEKGIPPTQTGRDYLATVSRILYG